MTRCAGVALLCAGLAHCGVAGDQQPTSAQIESAGIAAAQGRQSAALNHLEHWAQDGLPIAQRELGLVYAATPATQTQAVSWLVRAAEGGDKEAQRVLAQAYYDGRLGLAINLGKAWALFEAAAHQGDGKSSFMLARMAKYGQGVTADLSLSVHWLLEASSQGNAQAMFLLSNAYASGDGVARDPALSRQWLERSAEGDYPVAIQALAMDLEAQTKTDPTASSTARHLLKEATDERTMKWNRYQ